MSRIGYKPIKILPRVDVSISDGGEFGYKMVTVKGPKGELTQSVRRNVEIKVDGDEIILERINNSKQSRSLHGLYRSLIANMIEGVVNGFTKELKIEGIGYRAQMIGDSVELSLGYSHKILAKPPEGVSVEVPEQTEIKVTGIDKQKVGHFAAEIRSYRKPEPYKGKGVRYKDEQIRRKDVKSAS